MLGDYEAVMPLPWNRKFGISYIYPPYFTQQLGIYSPSPVSPEMTGAFLQQVPQRFRLVQVHLNSGNPLDEGIGDKWKIRYRKSYFLELNLPYNQLSRGYHDRVRKNTHRAENSGLILETGVSPQEIVKLCQWKLQETTSLRPSHYRKFLELATYALSTGLGKTLGVRSPGGDLLSGAFFLFGGGKAHYLIAGNAPGARSSGASQFLVDGFIRKNAGTSLKLDFTGSDIPGIAFFNEGFGAREEQFAFLTRNTLPFPVRLIK